MGFLSTKYGKLSDILDYDESSIPPARWIVNCASYVYVKIQAEVVDYQGTFRGFFFFLACYESRHTIRLSRTI